MFAKKLLIVAFVSFAIAWLMGMYFDQRYKKRWAWLYFDKMKEAQVEATRKDVLFIGNSRTQTGINPYLVDSITGLNTYNMGIGGADEQEIKLLAIYYLQHQQPPAMVVWGLDPAMLTKYNILKERFAYLFFLGNDSIRSTMRHYGFPVALIRYIPFLKYSFFDEYNRTSLFLRGPTLPVGNQRFYKGFLNAFSQLNEDSSSGNAQQFFRLNDEQAAKEINDTAVMAIRQTIELFQSKGTRLVFLMLPSRKSISRNGEVFTSRPDSLFLSLARQYNIPLIRSDTSSSFSYRHFVDDHHLNEPGSVILSQEVADFIRTNLLN